MYQKYIVRWLGLLVSSIALFAFAAMAQAATLAVSPASNSVAVGSTFTVNIVLDTTGQAVAGVDVFSLHFNPAVLQVVDADSATAGVQITAGTLMTTNQYNTVDNANGVIQFSQISSTSGSNFTGSGNLASITFTAVGTGSSNLTFDFTPGSTTDTNVAVLYSDVLTAVTNGSYTVNPAADVTPPSTPTGLTASSTSSTAVNLNWTASTDNVSVAGYQVFRCTGAACTPSVQVATSTPNSFSNTGLTASTVYGYRIKAYDAAGNVSGFSSTVSVTTPAAPDTTPPVISSVVAGSITQTGTTITWTTNENSNTQVVYGTTVSYGSQSTLNTSLVTSHSVAITGLSPGTLYHYQVKSKDAAGNLATSADSSFTTQSAPDTTAPTAAITNPASSGQNVSGTITVAVSSSDPTVTGQVTSGLFLTTLFIDGSTFATSTSGTLSVSLDTTRLANATHTLTATARDNAGNTGSSSAVTIIVFNVSNATHYPRKFTIGSLEGLPSVTSNLPVTVSVLSPTTGSVLETQTPTADASGNYSVTFLSTDPQIVNIRVKSTLYLSQLISNIDTTINSSAVTTLTQLLAGDFNNDNTINALDYSIMNAHWNQSFTQSDINNDGLINSIDFAILKNNYNKAGQ